MAPGPLAEAVRAARGGVGAMVDALSSDELRCASHDELSTLLRVTRTVQARLQFVQLAVVREVDTRGSYTEDGALSTAAWVRMQARMTPGEAFGAVRTARVLGSGMLPATAAALAAGEVDHGHVRAIATGVEGAPVGAVALIEPEALEVARQADPRAVTALMRRFTHSLDPDAADEAALARYERRGLTLSPLPDGAVHIRGLADDVNGSLIGTAVDAASPLVPGDRRTAAQRRLDALGDICRRFLAGPDAPMIGGGHAHVIVTVDGATVSAAAHPAPGSDDGAPGAGAGVADAAARAASLGLLEPDDWFITDLHRPDTDSPAPGGGPGATLSWVGPIAGSTARRVACDADVTVVLIDEHGRVTHEQRHRRFFTPAQRRAMIARDGDRCAVPYCDRPIAWSDGHHLVAWSRGGPTTAANGALPCAGHHTLLHEGGWHLQRLPDGRYLMRHRDGKTIGPEPHRPGNNRPPPRRRE